MLWPYKPLADLMESIEFSTDLMKTRSLEQRIRRLDVPRRTFNMAHKFTKIQYEKARNAIRTNLPNPFFVPEWSEGKTVNLAAGQTVLNIDTTNAQYFQNGYAVVVRDGEGEVFVLDAVTDTSVTLHLAASQNWQNAFFAPASPAYLIQGMSANHTRDGFFDVQLEWTIYNGYDWQENTFPIYRGSPVLTTPAQVGDGFIAEKITREVQMVDNGMSVPFFDTAYNSAIQSLGAKWILKRNEIFTLRKWFYFLKGKQKSFWLPSWNQSINLLSDITNGDTDIVIENVGFSDAYEDGGDLFIHMNNGTVYTLQVTGGTAYADENETLFLTSPAPANINRSDIKTICFMFKVRLDSDRIEFSYIPGYGASVQTPCVEVPI